MKSLSLFIFTCFVGFTDAFTFGSINKHTKQTQVLHAATTTTTTTISTPSWEELSDILTERTGQSPPPTPPKVTLYRDVSV